MKLTEDIDKRVNLFFSPCCVEDRGLNFWAKKRRRRRRAETYLSDYL